MKLRVPCALGGLPPSAHQFYSHTYPQLTIYLGKVLLLIMKTDFWQFKLKNRTEFGLCQKTAR